MRMLLAAACLAVGSLIAAAEGGADTGQGTPAGADETGAQAQADAEKKAQAGTDEEGEEEKEEEEKEEEEKEGEKVAATPLGRIETKETLKANSNIPFPQDI